MHPIKLYHHMHDNINAIAIFYNVAKTWSCQEDSVCHSICSIIDNTNVCLYYLWFDIIIISYNIDNVYTSSNIMLLSSYNS